MDAKDKGAEAPTMSDEQRRAELVELASIEAQIAERRRQLGGNALEAAPQSEYHTWPDGSSAVGVPPFPDESPKQRAARLADEHAIAHGAHLIPHGMKRSGEAPAIGAAAMTETGFEEKVGQQLASDIASGKSPDTINPTTASDKPELAGIAAAPIGEDVVLPADPTPEELAKVAASIKPGSDLARDPTPEEVEAAVTQVARETKGPVVVDPPAVDEKPASTSKKTK